MTIKDTLQGPWKADRFKVWGKDALWGIVSGIAVYAVLRLVWEYWKI